jgi:glc operon protein GlcG
MSRLVLVFSLFAALAAGGIARAQGVIPYGMPISLADAKKAAAAAEAEARKITPIPYCIAVVDPAGRLIYFERMDDAQIGSIRIAIDKARSAALFRRPTKVFEDILAHGRTAILALHGAMPSEGGLPLVEKGKVVGAIGASAGTPAQDGQVAQAGVEAIQ